jgi:hypothetical protein
MWPSCHTESERTMDPTAALAQGEQLLEQAVSGHDPQALAGNGQQRSWLGTPVNAGRAEADRPRQSSAAAQRFRNPSVEGANRNGGHHRSPDSDLSPGLAC